MPVQLDEELDFPIDAAWKMVSTFDGLKAWHPDVVACRQVGSGAGAERIVQVGDREVRERLDVLDARSHTLAYTITAVDDPAMLGMQSGIAMRALPGGRTAIRWTTGYADGHPLAAEVNPKLAAYYRTRIGHLRSALAGEPLK